MTDISIEPGASVTINVTASQPDPAKVEVIQELIGFTPITGVVSDSLLDSLIKTLTPPPLPPPVTAAKPMPGSAVAAAQGDTIAAMEKRLGVAVPFLRNYFQWLDAAKIKKQLQDDAAAGRISYISIKPPGGSYPGWPLVNVGNPQMAALADAFTANKLGADISFHHEPENDRKADWGTLTEAQKQTHRDAFKTAFRNFVTYMRPKMPANVHCDVFTPMDYTLLPEGKAKWGDLDLWNPGDDVVGIMGMDCYNGQAGLDATLAYAKKHGKKLVIGECGVLTTQDQVGWLKTLDAWARKNADTVLGWCWWSNNEFKLNPAGEAELAALIHAYAGR